VTRSDSANDVAAASIAPRTWSRTDDCRTGILPSSRSFVSLFAHSAACRTPEGAKDLELAGDRCSFVLFTPRPPVTLGWW
jgi:hypothetical protein